MVIKRRGGKEEEPIAGSDFHRLATLYYNNQLFLPTYIQMRYLQAHTRVITHCI